MTSSMSGGGAQRTIQYLSSNFAKENEVIIVSQADILFYQIHPSVVVKTLHVNPAPSNVIARVINMVKCTLKTNYEIARLSPDIVFSMMAYDAKHILMLHKMMGFSLITSERNNPEMQKEKKAARIKYKIFTQSDGIVFQTNRAKAFFPKHISEKGIIIHNAVGNELAYSLTPPPKRDEVICAVGRLHKQKNYPLLLNAFSMFLEAFPSYKLKIFGQGPEESNLRELAEKLGIENSVVFEGQKKDALQDVSRSSCYVLSSDYEGMPNTLLEAMAVGVPCVSTDCPNGPAELIEDGKTGLLVPVGNVEALCSAIIRAVTDRELIELCEKNALVIRETHGVERISREYLDYVYSVQSKRRS